MKLTSDVSLTTLLDILRQPEFAGGASQTVDAAIASAPSSLEVQPPLTARLSSQDAVALANRPAEQGSDSTEAMLSLDVWAGTTEDQRCSLRVSAGAEPTVRVDTRNDVEPAEQAEQLAHYVLSWDLPE